MSEPKYPKGPWHVQEQKGRHGTILGLRTAEGFLLDAMGVEEGERGTLHPQGLPLPGEALRAAFALMAAAPELVEAVEQLLPFIKEEYPLGDSAVTEPYRAALAALKKAKGDS